MHELSLCQSIVRVVDRARQGRDVSVVHLRVGQLRQVVPETLTYCWSLVTEAGPLAGARLDIEHIPIELSCRACRVGTTVTERLVLVCGACGSGDVDLLSGEEFEITSMDLVAEPP